MKKFKITVCMLLLAVWSPMIIAQTLSGTVTTPIGDLVTDVVVNLYDANGSLVASQTANGQYSFNNVNLGETYNLEFVKDISPLNGVSTYDAVVIARHILGIQALDTAEKLLAADVNLTGTITTLDILLIRRVILNIDQAFPVLPAWRFVESAPSTVSNNTFSVTINNNNEVFDVNGIKLGDVNNSVIP